MLMTNETIKLYWHDRILAKTVLRLIPKDIKPNHLTVLRVLLTPVVLLFLWRQEWDIVVPLFVFTAATDMLDGSLARVRKQITLWGTVADPAADKLLVGSVVVLFVAQEINPVFATIILVIELMIILTGIVRRTRGEYVSANWYGKMKMLFQVSGITMLLIAKWSDVDLFVPFSIGTFSIGIVFAVISLLTYGL